MENREDKLIVSSAPHLRGLNTTQLTMLDVIIALLPTVVAGIIFMGYRACIVTLTSVAACIFFEWGWNFFLKKENNSIKDLSAVVTGIMLAMVLPVTVPIWMLILGDLFAIIVVKQFFGGIGHNFMNPALAARAFMLSSFAVPMTTWVEPFTKLHILGNVDAVSSATPLMLIKNGGEGIADYMSLFLGNVGGCIGETSALAILIGALYLLCRRVISIKTPVAFIITFGFFMFIFGGKTLCTGNWLYHILSGGLLFGAVFMATDYVTTPYTPVGQIVFGVGCGLLSAIIRIWGGYPEGVSYAILIMNVLTPIIDKYTVPKCYSKKGAGLNV